MDAPPPPPPGDNALDADAAAASLAADGDEAAAYPQKKYFRSRAHCNPLSNNDGVPYPASPTALDWAALYPGADGPCVDFLDVGCGFGGLAVALAQEAPDKRTLALEIRPKVAEFVKRRVEALRARHPGTYANVACLRYNAMLHLPNLLPKRALDKIFFCFPDPHFKAKNHRRRIVSTALLAEYAYVLKPGGTLYAITDVEELHVWHVATLDAHPCFEAIALADDDPFLRCMRDETEEGKKVTRQGGHMKDGSKYHCAYRRRAVEEVDARPALWPAGD